MARRRDPLEHRLRQEREAQRGSKSALADEVERKAATGESLRELDAALEPLRADRSGGSGSLERLALGMIQRIAKRATEAGTQQDHIAGPYTKSDGDWLVMSMVADSAGRGVMTLAVRKHGDLDGERVVVADPAVVAAWAAEALTRSGPLEEGDMLDREWLRPMDEGPWRVSWTWLGEGIDGDWAANDPDDVPLLRLDLEWTRTDDDGDEIHEIHQSLCTRATAFEPEESLRSVALRVLDAARGRASVSGTEFDRIAGEIHPEYVAS